LFINTRRASGVLLLRLEYCNRFFANGRHGKVDFVHVESDKIAHPDQLETHGQQAVGHTSSSAMGDGGGAPFGGRDRRICLDKGTTKSKGVIVSLHNKLETALHDERVCIHWSLVSVTSWTPSTAFAASRIDICLTSVVFLTRPSDSSSSTYIGVFIAMESSAPTILSLVGLFEKYRSNGPTETTILHAYEKETS
jgi:hypothetical protein